MTAPRYTLHTRRMWVIGLVIVALYLGSTEFFDGPPVVPTSARPSATSARSAASPRPKPTRNPVRAQEVAESIATFTTAGLIQKFDIDLHTAHVDPTYWRSLNIDKKRGVTIMLAEHCDANGKGELITVYDYYSGKKLAKYGAFGFKLY